MLFQLVLTTFFKSELFSYLPNVHHVIKSCKAPIGLNLRDGLSVSEIQNIELWVSMNRMKLNLTKTWELVMRETLGSPSPWHRTHN